MNLARLICLVRGHDWTRWRTRPRPFAMRDRRCKRCGKTETAPLLAPVRKRAANAADTTTGIKS